MSGIDDWIAGWSDSTSLLIVMALAVLLGLRHATDPRPPRRRLGARRVRGRAFSSLGHADSASCGGSGTPPPSCCSACRSFSSRRISLSGATRHRNRRRRDDRWARSRCGYSFDGEGGVTHTHVHTHVHGHVDDHHGHGRGLGRRTPLGAYSIGLVHRGRAAPGRRRLAVAGRIQNRAVAVASLVVFALCTAASMSLVSAGWGKALGHGATRRSLHRVTPALGVASTAFSACGTRSVHSHWSRTCSDLTTALSSIEFRQPKVALRRGSRDLRFSGSGHSPPRPTSGSAHVRSTDLLNRTRRWDA